MTRFYSIDGDADIEHSASQYRKVLLSGRQIEDEFAFMGSHKDRKKILVDPKEIVDFVNKGELFLDSEKFSRALCSYFHEYDFYSWMSNISEVSLIFEFGRLQGIREERQKRKKKRTHQKYDFHTSGNS